MSQDPLNALKLTPAEADSFLTGARFLFGKHEVKLDQPNRAPETPNLAAVKPHAPAVIRKKG